MQALLPGRVRGHAKSGVECWSEMMVLGSFVTAWHHSTSLHLTSAVAVLPITMTVKLCIALFSRHFHYFIQPSLRGCNPNNHSISPTCLRFVDILEVYLCFPNPSEHEIPTLAISPIHVLSSFCLQNSYLDSVFIIIHLVLPLQCCLLHAASLILRS